MSRPDLFPKASAAGIIEDPNSQQRVIPESRRADGSIRKERKVKPGFTPAEDVGKYRVRAVLGIDGKKPGVPGSGGMASSSSSQGSDRRSGSVPGITRSSTPLSGGRSTGAPASTPGRADAALSWRSIPGSSTSSSTGSSPAKNVRKELSEAPDAWDDEVPSPRRSAAATAAAATKPRAPRGGVLAAAAMAAASVSSPSASPSKGPGRTKAVPSAAQQEQEGETTTAATEEEAEAHEDKDPAKRAKALAKKLRAAEALKEKETAGEKLLPEQKQKVDAIEEMMRELEGLKVSDVPGEQE